MPQPLSLVIAEAALETVPKKLTDHPSVRNHAEKTSRKPSEILLDRSYHHAAMKGMQSDWKRGRPDIVHLALVEALATPLFKKGLLKMYIHTINDKLILIGDNLRIPKSYLRFEGLMIDLFKNKAIKSREGQLLLELRDNITFGDLVKNMITAERIIALSTKGIRTSADQLVFQNVSDSRHCAFVIGGFPKGHFSEDISSLCDCTYSIGSRGLEGHVVIARILYECERALSLTY